MHSTPFTTTRPLVMLVLLLLAGCAHQADLTQRHDDIQTHIAQARAQSPVSDAGLVQGTGFHLTHGKTRPRTPAILRRTLGAPGLRSLEAVSVSAFASHLSEHIGYPVDIAGDVYNPRESGSSRSGAVVSAGEPASADDAGRARSLEHQLPLLRYSLAPSETIASALTRTVGGYGLSWSLDAEAQRFTLYRYEIAVFRIPTPTSSRRASISLSDGRANTTVTSTQAIAASILKTATALLSEEGQVELSETGVIVVSDVPSSVSAIRRYIDTETLNLSRQVVISTRLYTYNDERANRLGLHWSAVYQNSQYALDAPGTPSGILGGVSAIIRRVNPTSDFTGTTLNLDALATASNLSVLYASDLVTLSGFPVTTNDFNNTAYLKSISRSISENTGRETTTLEPGEVSTGLALYIDPTVRGNDIYLSLSFSLSALLALNEEASGGDRITTPEVSVRDASQVVKLASGGAVALTGFQVAVTETKDRGVGDPQFKLLGGASQARRQTRDAVLVVMARIVE